MTKYKYRIVQRGDGSYCAQMKCGWFDKWDDITQSSSSFEVIKERFDEIIQEAKTRKLRKQIGKVIETYE